MMPEGEERIEDEPRELHEFDRSILIKTLLQSHEVWKTLGTKGKEQMQKNIFGENALRVDLENEAAIIEYLRKLNIPIEIHSEEHGTISLGDPAYIAVLDGLDGSRVYLSDREHGRYGTTLGIFKGKDPSYDDYITGGILEHSTGDLYIAEKSKGSFKINVHNGKEEQIHSSTEEDLRAPKVKIYIDEFFTFNKEHFTEKLKSFHTIGYSPENMGASSRSYMDVASGQAEFALECTRKGNLEIASVYGLINEAGGVIVDIDGNSLGPQKYLKFGQNEQLPVITAANEKLAIQLINYLKKYERNN